MWRFWFLLLVAVSAQLLLFSEIRLCAASANAINALVVFLAMIGRRRAAIVMAVIGGTALEFATLSGLGYAGVSLVASVYFIDWLLTLIGRERGNQLICLLSGIAVNQITRLSFLLAAGIVDLGNIHPWCVLVAAIVMDSALAVPLLFYYLTKQGQRTLRRFVLKFP